METEAALHRHIRGPLATTALLALIAAFAIAPLFPVDEALLGYAPALSLPLGALGIVWTFSTVLVFRRLGRRSPAYRFMNRVETAILVGASLLPIVASGNAANPLWILHFAHVVTCGTSGGERRYNFWLFTVGSALTALAFAFMNGPAVGALVAAIGGVSLYAYTVLSATAQRLSTTKQQRDHLQAQLTALTVSKERARIARDLHDGVGAELSSLFWQLQSLKAMTSSPEAQANFEALTQRIRQSTDELRNVVWELRATSLAWPELIAHLRTRCAELAGDVASVSFEADEGEAFEVPGEIRMHVARIVQEAVRNAIHHGRATKVALRLRVGHQLSLEVEDDGTGISPEALRRSVGGLRNMQVRVEALGGTLLVSQRVGGGTQVRAAVPLVAQASTG